MMMKAQKCKNSKTQNAKTQMQKCKNAKMQIYSHSSKALLLNAESNARCIIVSTASAGVH